MIRSLLLPIVFSLTTVALPAQESGSPLGLVIQVQGTVYLQRGSAKRAARLADPLFAGDRVLADAGEVVLLYCPRSEKLSVRAGSVVEISASEAKLLKGSPPQRTAGKCALPKIAFGNEDLNLTGGLRARGYPPIALYVGGPVSVNRPEFQWSAIENADSYHLSVRNVQSEVIWQSRVASPGAKFPADMPALADGEYEWEVRAQARDKTIAQGIASFEVKPNRALSASLEVSGESLLLRAIELENAGYYSEAAGIYRALREASPEDQRFTRRLAWLYWNAGLFNAVNDEMKKLGK